MTPTQTMHYCRENPSKSPFIFHCLIPREIGNWRTPEARGNLDNSSSDPSAPTSHCLPMLRKAHILENQRPKSFFSHEFSHDFIQNIQTVVMVFSSDSWTINSNWFVWCLGFPHSRLTIYNHMELEDEKAPMRVAQSFDTVNVGTLETKE